MTRLVAEDDDAGERLDVVLARRLDESRTRVAARIDRGEVKVDGRVVSKSYRPEAGQEIVVAEPVADSDRDEQELPPPPLPPVRYRDEHLLVVAKPAGLVVHPGAGWPSGTLVDALRAGEVPLAEVGGSHRPGIVHRLDRDTSGLMIVASTVEAHHGLVEALRAREVRREYLALVAGEPPAEEGRIEAPLGRDPHDRKRFAPVAGGKPAVTRWEVEDLGAVGSSPVALLRLRLETGRTHQIRVHCAGAGIPVIGDDLYGDTSLAGQLGLERMFLHAARLRFLHPVTSETIDLDEPLPEDLAQAAGRAGVLPGRKRAQG